MFICILMKKALSFIILFIVGSVNYSYAVDCSDLLKVSEITHNDIVKSWFGNFEYKNDEQSIGLFRQIALDGIENSSFSLGLIYLTRKEISNFKKSIENYKEAIKWFETSLKNRNGKLSYDFLARIHALNREIIIENNFPEKYKLRWINNSAQNGDLLHQVMLGLIKRKEAYRYYKENETKDTEFTIEEINLGFQERVGRNTQNYREAIKWFEYAVTSGSLKANFPLGLIHFYIKAFRDYKKAKVYFERVSGYLQEANKYLYYIQQEF